MSTTDEAQQVDDLLDIPEVFHSVVRKYGRDMFALVMATGNCTEAAKRLGTILEKHKSAHGLRAVTVLCSSFNELASALCVVKEWEEEDLVMCDRDIQLAFAGSVQPAGSKIILNS